MSNYIQVKPSNGWDRPSDWLPIPSYGANEEVFYGLHAVWDTTVNPVAFLLNGTGSGYTVDWGDGNITNHAFNTKAEYNYVYANLSASTECSRGYRQAMIKVTPQAGAVITLFNISQKHTNFSYVNHTWFLQMKLNFSNVSFINREDYLIHTNIESLEIKQWNNTTGYYEAKCRGMSNLRKFELKSAPNYIIPFSLFHDCYNLIDVSLPPNFWQQQTYLPYTFQGIRDLKIFGSVELPNVTNYTSSFRDCLAKDVSNFIFPTSAIITVFDSVFSFSYISKIPLINLSNCINIGYTTYYQRVHNNINWFGLKISHSIANQLLDAAELNKYFTNLGTANSGASITITGNPGANTCNQSIATAKGWTVIN